MRLSDIRESVQRIAEAVSAALKVEVEIADERLFRVAGTGKAQVDVLRTMAGEDHVYQTALRTGQPVVIQNPGFHETCKPCVHYGNCRETGEICCPIQWEGRRIGVIGLLAFDQHQRKRLFENVEVTMNFLEKMAELIAASLTSHERLQQQQLAVKQLTEKIQNQEENDPFLHLIGMSQAMLATKEKARKVAASDSSILIRGESGTGKELFAKAIHQASHRGAYTFMSINCGAIPEHLLESELFGYEEGAFTGAKKGGKPGKIELANKGTLFLDEIGDMPLLLQVKLLRVLQEKQIERIGSVKGAQSVDVRIIAATHRDLEKMVRDGQFREDLYYRLNVIPLSIPPLRDRRDDIVLLAHHFLQPYAASLGKQVSSIHEDAKHALLKYEWPGNVRELANAMEYAVNMELTSRIGLDQLPSNIKEQGTSRSHNGKNGMPVEDELNLKEIEKRTICAALEKVYEQSEPKEKAAELLGISRATLFRKINEYGIQLNKR